MLALTETETDWSLLSEDVGSFMRKFGPIHFFTFANITVSIIKYIGFAFSSVIVVTAVSFT